MQVKLGRGAAVATAFALATVAPSAAAIQVAAPSVSPMLTQIYTCSTPIGDVSIFVDITGKATVKKGKVTLKNVTYSVNNDLGFDLVIDNVKVSVPDPSKKKAPYVDGSVKVAKDPKGWKAGHDKTGIFALYKGTQTVTNGSSVDVAALSATYSAQGPKGTLVEFKAGMVTFHAQSPVEGDVVCTPDDPAGTFASVTL